MKIGNHDLYKYSLPIIDSNMYVLASNKRTLVIDPIENIDAFNMLEALDCTDITILLTHEHFDHISGVNAFRNFASKRKIDCNVYAQKICADAIEDPLENLSQNSSVLFMFKPVEERHIAQALVDSDYTCSADFIFDDALTLVWEDLKLILKSTPGHTPGSICIEFYDQSDKLLALATGDSLIPGQKTITRLPRGSKKDFYDITMPYLKSFAPDTLILPGHGELSFMSTCRLS